MRAITAGGNGQKDGERQNEVEGRGEQAGDSCGLRWGLLPVLQVGRELVLRNIRMFSGALSVRRDGSRGSEVLL